MCRPALAFCALLALSGVAFAQSGNRGAPAGPTPGGSDPGPSAQQAGSVALEQADRDFLARAARGALYELATAKLAADKAKAEDVKDYARRLVKDHEAYGAALQKIAKESGLTLPTDMGQEDKTRTVEQRRLQGEDYDRAFIAEAIRVNAQDKKESDEALRATKSDVVKNFIGQFAAADAEHQRMAQDLAKKHNVAPETGTK